MKDTFEKQERGNIEFEERKISLEKPLTDWVYQYDNRREIINPFFLKEASIELSLGILATRLEYIQKECGIDLGTSLIPDNDVSNGLYQYLYFYSKNRPKDSEMSFRPKKYR